MDDRISERIIDTEIKLILYYRNDESSFQWRQNLDVFMKVVNRDKPYDIELLHEIYDYPFAHCH